MPLQDGSASISFPNNPLQALMAMDGSDLKSISITARASSPAFIQMRAVMNSLLPNSDTPRAVLAFGFVFLLCHFMVNVYALLSGKIALIFHSVSTASVKNKKYYPLKSCELTPSHIQEQS